MSSLRDIPTAQQFFRASQQALYLFQARPDLFDIELAGEYEGDMYFFLCNIRQNHDPKFLWLFFCENNKKERKKPKTQRREKKKKVDLMFLQCFPILKDNIIHNLCMATTNEKQLIHGQWLATK